MRDRGMRTLATPALLAALLIGAAGCSGDDGDEESEPTPSPSPTFATPDNRPVGAPTKDCTATIRTRGSLERQFEGEAQVTLRGATDEGPGPQARYQFTRGQNYLTLFSEGPDWTKTATMQVAGEVFNADPERVDGLQAQENGKAAKARIIMIGSGGTSFRLFADFVCGKRNAGN